MDWTKFFPSEFRQASSAKLRSFGLIMAIPLIIVAALLFWKSRAAAPYWAGAAALMALLGLVLPQVLKPLYIAWMTFAYYLSFVTTYIILTLFFFIAVTPSGLIMRLFGKDPMNRRFPGKEASYWIKSQTYENTVERYSKPY